MLCSRTCPIGQGQHCCSELEAFSGICSRTNKVGTEHNQDVSLPRSMFQEKMG